VLATDIEPVLSAVLAPNVAAGLRALPQGSGNVTVRHLDWLDVSAGAPLPLSTDELALDILVTADTVYAAHLVPYLWSTVARVCREAERNAIADSESKSELLSSSRRAPTIYIAIERRDPRMVDSAVAQGRAAGVELKRVAHGRVAKAVERAYGWKEEEWAGVEVWKGRWRGSVEA
jgi:hypothetical protein